MDGKGTEWEIYPLGLDGQVQEVSRVRTEIAWILS